jgi:hypothetical protein
MTDVRYISGQDNVVADALSRVESVIAPPSYDALVASKDSDDELGTLLGSTTAQRLEKPPISGTTDSIYCDTSAGSSRPYLPDALRHPSNYRGCSHAREEVRRRKAQRTPKNTTGRVFSSNYTTPGISFLVALRNNAEQQQQPHPHRVSVAGPAAVEKRSVLAPVRQNDAGQSVPVTDVKSQPLDNMLRVVTVVQQIMAEFNGAVSKEDKNSDQYQNYNKTLETKWPLEFLDPSKS